MMNCESIELRVFGVLRKIADERGYLKIEIPTGSEGMTARALTCAIEGQVRKAHPSFDSSVIFECALADEEKILAPEARPGKMTGLALLPPVCGG